MKQLNACPFLPLILVLAFSSGAALAAPPSDAKPAAQTATTGQKGKPPAQKVPAASTERIIGDRDPRAAVPQPPLTPPPTNSPQR